STTPWIKSATKRADVLRRRSRSRDRSHGDALNHELIGAAIQPPPMRNSQMMFLGNVDSGCRHRATFLQADGSISLRPLPPDRISGGSFANACLHRKIAT